jgi:hypothetical protein
MCNKCLLLLLSLCLSMDRGLLAVLQAAPAAQGPSQHRQHNIAKAREALQALARERQIASHPVLHTSEQQLQLAALCIPGASSALGIKPSRGHAIPMLAMCRLAVSPKVTGSGSSVDRIRKLQHSAYALVAHSTLALQKQGHCAWVEATSNRASAADADEHFVRGMSFMWDEAGQKMRAMVEKKLAHVNDDASRAQSRVEVMVMLGDVCQLKAMLVGDAYHRSTESQPWIMAPQVVGGTGHLYILEGLARSLPVQLESEESINTWAQGVLACVASACFDSASGNIAAMSCLVDVCTRPSSKLCLHLERCATHQIHIIKASCCAMVNLASMLYSISKVLRVSRTLNALRNNIYNTVKSSFVVRYGEAPSITGLRKAVMQIMGIDGDELDLYRIDKFGKRHPKKFLQDLLIMIETSRFDLDTKEWVHYSPPPVLGHRQRFDLDELVGKHVQPILKVFVNRRWPEAALSRWTGVMTCLKRVAIGGLMNNFFGISLSTLDKKLEYKEADIRADMARKLARCLAGEEVDTKREVHATRVIKLASYFSDCVRQWQMIIIIMGASIVDKLHWVVLGRGPHQPKATLAEMIDPFASPITIALNSSFKLMKASAWTCDGPWGLLQFFGIVDFKVQHLMRFALRVLVQCSASVYLRLAARFASWPYRLHWLLNDRITTEEKRAIAQDFIDARECCLGPFAKTLRTHYGTVSKVLSEQCKSILIMWAFVVRLSTGPVECEHKIVKDEVHSASCAVMHAPVCHRAVCRHLQQAHLVRGGEDLSLQLGRRKVWSQRSSQQSASGHAPNRLFTS